MTITFGLVVLCVLGALVYVLASNGKLQILGLVAFACALLALCLSMSRGSLRLGLSESSPRALQAVEMDGQEATDQPGRERSQARG